LSTPEEFQARFFERFPHGVIRVGADRRVLFGNARGAQLLGRSTFTIGEPLAAGTLSEFAELVLESPDETHTTRLVLPEGRVLRVSGLGQQGAGSALLLLDVVTAQERHDRIMREFLRNAAHQLRTPLTAITTTVEVLQAGAKHVPADRDRFLEHIEAHAERLIRIAHGLLVLARAQLGEPIRLTAVDLRPLLEELEAETQPMEGVRIIVDCEPGLVALAEGDLLHEALAALLENAVAHTDAGEIHLCARKLNGAVKVSVTDSGGGVLPEHRARIFEPFYRPNAEGGQGFGLGLAIAAEAARAMKGELTVDDRDIGASFTIRLVPAEDSE